MKPYLDTFSCPCGKIHPAVDCRVEIGAGVISTLPDIIRSLGAQKPFVLADVNTYKAAGARVCEILSGAKIPHALYVFPSSHPEPDEGSVGAAVMHYDPTCDLILAVGSGVINDIGKILSVTSGHPYIIVATAPSMDGYASASSSMTRDGLKISLPTRHADAIVGDTDILKNAPMDMLVAGIGDMLAKYISIGEWRIAHIITGEYYCEQVAELVRSALRRCVENAEGLLRRQPAAVEAVFEGLIIGGVAMALAGVSRPASGVEHYISHIWDMRGVAFGTPMAPHGIQCAIGTLYAARVYDALREMTPNSARAAAYVAAFDFGSHAEMLRGYIGVGAEAMIAAEEKDGKYDLVRHAARLARISEHWSEIQAVIREEIPPAAEIERLLTLLGAPRSCADIGLDPAELPLTFAATKDIRDKYVLSRLCFDLGIMDDVCLE